MSQATRIEDGLAFIKDTYSDCTILIAGGELLSAHRLVLHLQSPVFEVLLREKVTSDEETGTILDLQDDDPDALRAMLHFFYHGNYEVPQSMNGMAFHVAVAQIADVRTPSTAWCFTLMTSTDFRFPCRSTRQQRSRTSPTGFLERYSLQRGGLPKI